MNPGTNLPDEPDFLGPVPVELVEGFDEGEARSGEAAGNTAILAALAFAFDEAAQILHGGPLIAGGLIGQGLMLFLDEGEVESLELFVELSGFAIHGRRSWRVEGRAGRRGRGPVRVVRVRGGRRSG